MSGISTPTPWRLPSRQEGGVILTSDVDDLERLAAAYPNNGISKI